MFFEKNKPFFSVFHLRTIDVTLLQRKSVKKRHINHVLLTHCNWSIECERETEGVVIILLSTSIILSLFFSFSLSSADVKSNNTGKLQRLALCVKIVTYLKQAKGKKWVAYAITATTKTMAVVQTLHLEPQFQP